MVISLRYVGKCLYVDSGFGQAQRLEWEYQAEVCFLRIAKAGCFHKGIIYPEKRKESRKMTGIADVHSHILPGLDDGAPAGKISVEMLRAASAQGIRRVIATPHYSFQFPNADPRQDQRTVQGTEQKSGKRGDSVPGLSGTGDHVFRKGA